MSEVFRAAVQTTVIADANEDVMNFDFQDFAVEHSGIRAFLSGNISVNFTIVTSGASAEATPAITLVVRARNMKTTELATGPVVCANDIQTILTAAVLATTGRYSYPITSPFGACDGIQVGFTYPAGTAAKIATIVAWLEAE